MKVTLELSEKYPTGWLVVDTIDVSRFEPEEVEQIISFNENKGRRCAIRLYDDRAGVRVVADMPVMDPSVRSCVQCSRPCHRDSANI